MRQPYSCFGVGFFLITVLANSERCVNFMDLVASKTKGASGGQNCEFCICSVYSTF